MSAVPSNERAKYLQLHRLASERARLERELENWVRKRSRIEVRLNEIDRQMAGLRGAIFEPRDNGFVHERPTAERVTLEY